MSPPTSNPTPRPRPPDQPERIGDYEILHVLGSGGMATVYAAMQRQPKRMVAIKVIRSEAEGPRAERRFRQEIEILGRLRHPHVAQIFEAGTFGDGDAETPYYVMEYVPQARTLLEYVATDDPDLDARLRLFVKICAAVEHGHRNKVIHRDLKPANILVDGRGEPKVIDFGVARSQMPLFDEHTGTTEAGRLVGTLQYMSPEQLRSDPVDIDTRCDVYALGALLYRLLTSRAPLDLLGLPVHTAVQMIRKEDPPPPSAHKPELKGDLDAIVMRALAKDRNDRYLTAGALGRDVVRHLKRRPVRARPSTVGYRARLFLHRNRIAAISVAVVAVVVLVATGWSIAQHLRTEARLRELQSSPNGGARAVVDDGPGVSTSNGDETSPDQPPTPAPRPAMTFTAHRDVIESLAFDAAGERIVAGCRDGTASVWTLAPPNPPAQVGAIDDHAAPVAWVSFDAGGRGVVLTAAEDGYVAIADARTGAPVSYHEAPCANPVALAMRDDQAGTSIIASCDDLTIRVPTAAGEVLTLRGTTGTFTTLRFSPDGTWLAAASARGTVYAWSLPGGETIARFAGHDDPIVDVVPHAEGTVVTVVLTSGTAWTWDAAVPESPRDRRRLCDPPVRAFGVSLSGGLVVVVGDETLTVLDLGSGVRATEDVDNAEHVSAVAVTDDGTRVALGLKTGQVRLQSVTWE